jgi:hypothetical protein
MLLLAETTPAIVDLTHPQELLQFGKRLLELSQWLILVTIGLGVVLGIVNFSYRRERGEWLEREFANYGQLLNGLRHLVLSLVVVIALFFACSTLANRYHHWEYSKIAKALTKVAGDSPRGTLRDRVEHLTPQVKYEIAEPYTITNTINGKIVEVKKTRNIDRFLSPTSTQVNVNLTQTSDPASNSWIYQSDFDGTYQFTNTLTTPETFVFDAPPPIGYKLLENYRVTQDNRRLEAIDRGEYIFPIQLAPSATTQFKVTYRAQGAPRWIYNASGRILSKFRLSIWADFPNAEFASGIVPTVTESEGRGTRFTWNFAENVSVKNPFGVFTNSERFRHIGILPRLLILAPGIFAIWLLLVYLTIAIAWQDIAVGTVVFFACLLSLTYASRWLDPKLVWGLLSPILLLFGWQLGTPRGQRWSGLAIVFSGLVLPVFGLLVTYSGLTLGLAGAISIAWLLGTRKFDRQRE